MVSLRLARFGRHKLPFYRIVAVDSRAARDGAYIEQLGTFEPFKGVVKLDAESSLKWLNRGARPSETVRSLLKREGVYAKYLEGKKAKPAAPAAQG